jgi:hypothetical protein
LVFFGDGFERSSPVARWVIGFGGGVVIVPVVFYGLVEAGYSRRPGCAYRSRHLTSGLSSRLHSSLRGRTGRPTNTLVHQKKQKQRRAIRSLFPSHSRPNQTSDADSDAKCERTQNVLELA